MRYRQGFLLVTVLLVMVVVGLLVLATSFTALVDRRVAATQRGGTEAYYLAQAGLERLKTGAFLTIAAGFSGSDPTVCQVFGSEQLDLGGGVSVSPGTPVSIDYGPGNYTLSYVVDGNRFTLTSIGRIGDSQSTVQVVATAGGGPTGVWENAVYATRYSPPRSITQTGTIAAYGSVQIVEGEIIQDFSVSGSSGVFNNYSGEGSNTTVVPEAEKALGSARTAAVNDLCTRLKISRGDVIYQGSANVGDEDPVTGPRVNRIEGIYLGPTGTVRRANTTAPTAEQDLETNGIYTRNGVNSYEGFGLGFPELATNFPNDFGVNDQVVLREVGSGAGAGDCPLILEEGNGANRRTALFLPPTDSGASVMCGDADNFIRWNATTQQLELNGNVAIPSNDVVIRSDVTYSGQGTLRVGTMTANSDGEPVPAPGSTGVELNAQLLPADAEDGTYLDSTVIGIVSAGEVQIGGSPGQDPTIAALIYSASAVRTNQTYAIVGAVVAREVLTQSVPVVVFHPDVPAFAEILCLPGTLCDTGGEFGSAGFFRDVSFERR